MTKKKGCVGSNGWFPCAVCGMGYGSEECNRYRRGDDAKVRSEEISEQELVLTEKHCTLLPRRFRMMRP